MKYQLNLFFNALTFYSRLPAPGWVEYSDRNLQRSAPYISWVGLLIGALAAFSYWLSTRVLPEDIAIVLSMMVTLWATGAFHEDGLADCVDGLGGGWTTERVLEIMKDSRVGSYGVIALIIALLMKFQALSHISLLIPVLLLSHCLSRFIALSLMYTEPYVRSHDSKAGRATTTPDTVTLLTALLPVAFCFLLLQWQALLVLAPLLLLRQWLVGLFRRRIGGYTGDCLGACQQLSEILIYLFFCLPWFLVPAGS
ncbi:adenosylcobinamide-GDP ribazoletransferase [Marinobacterium jannaschii]|uniref:adenosylcobinamide-GDP ribazoletransferase n=1 Tax=Marinobacterium jannaschii TaxID=64970 RepID=UPI00055BF09C|nr:adenosylcobinamide-GDP ribazoletransferase [Marinobacterium jannaschii]